MDIPAYYADLTQNYLYYAGDSNGWHFGFWEDDVESIQHSLLRSNEILFRGTNPGKATRVLDVGCGIGGLAVWAAAKFGCHVAGITVTEEHILLARELAASKGVADLCEFHVMDMDTMTFDDASFDIVINQETMCHSADNRRFLEGVQRILKPGGYWRAIDYLLQEEPLSPSEKLAYRDVQEGWHIPYIPTNTEVVEILDDLGFKEINTADVTENVLPCARMILRQCRLPALAAKLHIDWIVYSFDPRMRNNRQGHIKASKAYCQGLIDGHIVHGYFSAVKSASAA